MAERYWVVGGEYESTRFTRMAGGRPEERHGPYADFAAARAQWAARAMATIDNAHIRYRIEREDSTEFWVVGGRYADTGFSALQGGAPEERIGPFADEAAASAAWRERAWRTIDDALVRYRIERV